MMISHLDSTSHIDSLIGDIRDCFSGAPAVFWLKAAEHEVTTLRTYSANPERPMVTAAYLVDLILDIVERRALSAPAVVRRAELKQPLEQLCLQNRELEELVSFVVCPLRRGDELAGVFFLCCSDSGTSFQRCSEKLDWLQTVFMNSAAADGRPFAWDGADTTLGDGLVGRSVRMRQLMADLKRIALTPMNVFIVGESGTGKELIARNIHKLSKRFLEAFIPVDAVALPSLLLESELFGHERGAFTGATKRKIGLLEFAHRGTLFLDEISELHIDLQAKLLRVLQERTFRRVGGHHLIDVDLRIISATNRDPQEAITTRQLREDLYYRLNGIPVHVPALRDRREDIPVLVQHFSNEFMGKSTAGEVSLTDDAVSCLCEYDWPGNVRELKNVIQRLVALSQKDTVDVDDLPKELLQSTSRGGSPGAEISTGVPFVQVRRRKVASIEKSYFCHLLEIHEGNISQVARAAGTSRKTIYQILKRHNLSPADFKGNRSSFARRYGSEAN